MNKATEEICSWFEEDFVILDTQTTGKENSDEIVEVGIIDKEGNELYHSLVKPTFEIPDWVVKFHGITNNAVKYAPTWKQIHSEVSYILQNKLVLCYNAEFDARLLAQTAKKYGLRVPKFQTGCVMRLFSEHRESRKFISLKEASTVNPERNVLDNCRATLQVIKKVWGEKGIAPRVYDDEFWKGFEL